MGIGAFLINAPQCMLTSLLLFPSVVIVVVVWMLLLYCELPCLGDRLSVL